MLSIRNQEQRATYEKVPIYKHPEEATPKSIGIGSSLAIARGWGRRQWGLSANWI